MTGFHVHRGALAALRPSAAATVEEVLAEARRVVMLEDIVDHTNVGAAIFRSAPHLASTAVVLSPRCADPLYRRSIKVGMGAVFSLPWTRLDDWFDAMPRLAAPGFQTIALTLAEDSLPIQDVTVEPRSALVVGSEGPGLTSDGRGGCRAGKDTDDCRDRLPECCRRNRRSVPCPLAFENQKFLTIALTPGPRVVTSWKYPITGRDAMSALFWLPEGVTRD